MNRKLSDRKYYLKNKETIKQKTKKYKQDNKKETKERNKNYYVNNKETFSKKSKEYYLRTSARPKKVLMPLHLWKTSCGDTIKKKARILLQRAVQKGRIAKPNKCICCKRVFPKRVIHGHHDNYKKWWDILWLCQTCHSELHIKRLIIKDKD